MTSTLDANILLYASDEESSLQQKAVDVIAELATGTELVYLFWPTITAYLRLATHPSVFSRPLRPEQAVANIDELLSRPQMRAPGENDGFWATLRDVLDREAARGNLVTDAHLVALMRQYGVRTILTRDRDFRRFDGIEMHDPFAAQD